MSENKFCSVCLSAVEREDAPILAISGSGVPRCLCDSCAENLEVASYGKDYDEITESIAVLASNLSDKNIDDPVTLGTMGGLLKRAAARATMIKDGTYDFSLDELDEEDSLEEIPEELLESEEDKQLDEEENERAEKLDKVLNWIWAGVMVAAVAFFAWWFFFR